MGCSETFPFSVNGYLFQWNSQKLWSDLFFLFFSHILSEYCQLLPSNKFRIQTLLTTLAATTPEQATIIFHQDTAKILLTVTPVAFLYTHSHTGLCVTYFISLGEITRCEIVESYGRRLFNFIRNCRTIFHLAPPPGTSKSSSCSASSPALGIFFKSF